MKRITSLLLAVLMLCTIIPFAVIPVSAAEETANAPVVNSAVLKKNINSADAATVYFGKDKNGAPIAWRVVGDETGKTVVNGEEKVNVQAPLNALTLISADSLEESVFTNSLVYTTDINNYYAESKLKKAIYESVKFTGDAEGKAIVPRTLIGGQVFSHDCIGIAGSTVENAVLWAPTIKDAKELCAEIRILEGKEWWLCSPDSSAECASSISNGNFTSTEVRDIIFVRPAFYLNLSDVLFASAAEGGKSNTAGNPAPANGDAWKLTLKDEARKNFKITKCKATDDTVTVNYEGASTGSNEYISYYILDKDGNILSYHQCAQSEKETGSVTFAKPQLGNDDKLYLINEQINGDCLTDYSSEPQAICFHENTALMCLDCGQKLTPDTESNSLTGSVLSDGSLTVVVGIAAAVIFGFGGFILGTKKKKKTALAGEKSVE